MIDSIRTGVTNWMRYDEKAAKVPIVMSPWMVSQPP